MKLKKVEQCEKCGDNLIPGINICAEPLYMICNDCRNNKLCPEIEQIKEELVMDFVMKAKGDKILSLMRHYKYKKEFLGFLTRYTEIILDDIMSSYTFMKNRTEIKKEWRLKKK